ncbi:DUF6735 family protein [Halorubrum pallidum]|uniref:DUF6735 family protein n=1 Tax=Halorubrum pallidum TaxID=1526114 RepID=A0ABD5T1I3_9EURY
MGHRALVAYERTDGQYTLHYSHWGAAALLKPSRANRNWPRLAKYRRYTYHSVPCI